MAEPDYDQGGNEYDYPSDGDLQESQIPGLRSQSEEQADKIPKCIHSHILNIGARLSMLRNERDALRLKTVVRAGSSTVIIPSARRVSP